MSHLKDYFKSSTIVQIQHWARSLSARASWFWFFTFFLSVVIFYLQVHVLLAQYNESRKPVKISIKNDIMPFPSITFCNLSPYKRSELHRIPDLEKLNNLIETLDDLNSTKESDQQPNIRKNSKQPLKKSLHCPKISPNKTYRLINREKNMAVYLSVNKTTVVQLEMSVCGWFDQFWVFKKERTRNPDDCIYKLRLLSKTADRRYMAVSLKSGSVDVKSFRQISGSNGSMISTFHLKSHKKCSECFSIGLLDKYVVYVNKMNSTTKGTVRWDSSKRKPHQWMLSEVGELELLPNLTTICRSVQSFKNHDVAENHIWHEKYWLRLRPFRVSRASYSHHGNVKLRIKFANENTPLGYHDILSAKKYAQDSTFTQTALLDSLPYVTGQLTTGLRYKTGFKLADLLVKCTFGGLACDMGRDFNVWNNLAVGNCFTYNHWNSTNLKWGRRPGRSSGLQVQIKTVQSDYMSTIVSSGLIMSITRIRQPILPETDRFLLSSGFSIDVGLTYLCWRNCYQRKVFEKCRCYDPAFDTFNVSEPQYCRLENRYCIIENRTKNDSDSNCSCRPQCKNQIYKTTITYALMTDSSQIISDKIIDRKDSILVNIYLKSLRYHSYDEQKLYELIDLISDVIGLSGIYFGVGFISVFEVLISICKFSRDLYGQKSIT